LSALCSSAGKALLFSPCRVQNVHRFALTQHLTEACCWRGEPSTNIPKRQSVVCWPSAGRRGGAAAFRGTRVRRPARSRSSTERSRWGLVASGTRCLGDIPAQSPRSPHRRLGTAAAPSGTRRTRRGRRRPQRGRVHRDPERCAPWCVEGSAIHPEDLTPERRARGLRSSQGSDRRPLRAPSDTSCQTDRHEVVPSGAPV